MNEIEFIKNMQTLEIRENDILIVKLDREVSADMNKIITKNVKDNLPDNIKKFVKVFVLEPGIDIGILRKSDKENYDGTEL